ncbi:lysophospholipase, putative [Plasmodium knowlesi strain H]|uniref:Lysophospholipase, putative n=3 Tax=Plasmodium knowlesi TaxID=5850 RepID=A0A1A7VVQ4_PLAKH|nr:lysophospholipase, putative [Plasmodium knowlesi strain H]OTN66762.1 putative Lysophospholipase [Plasmodium knowlesi]CAA9990051.1 lysophospholipase, putative [Plasmodium knowlesi strain H]SBO25708.1 lysophospholipase, putative [Plasmodium knowlesi strain H]SBO28523.1 lysophospholipase, putative [Plasmodium knowlesi strain H]VVS79525.1 lysophospholipase, putative [Plasmodium knowlesi strain H]
MVENEVYNQDMRTVLRREQLDGRPTIRSFFNKDGLLLRTYGWIERNAIGIILLIHGLNSHTRFSFLRHNVHVLNNNRAILMDGNNYYIYKDSWIEHFNKHRYSVFGIDLQGHGESEGWENLSLNVKKFDDLVYDVLEYIPKIQEDSMRYLNNDSNNNGSSGSSRRSNRNNRGGDSSRNYHRGNRIATPLPVYIIGQSMGGNVALRTLQLVGKNRGLNRRLNIRGCVSLSGMVAIEPLGLPSSYTYKCFFMPLSKIFSDFLPTLRILCKLPYKKFQYIRDIGRYDRMRYRNGITCKFAYELLRAMDNLDHDVRYMPRDIPILFIHSEKDRLCYPEGVVSFYNRLNIANKELHMLNYMEHMLSMEPGNERVLSKIMNWLHNMSRS